MRTPQAKLPPTPTQARVYRFVERSIREMGYPPTLREIAKHFGWRSENSAINHIGALVRKGWLVRDPLVSRGLRLTGR